MLFPPRQSNHFMQNRMRQMPIHPNQMGNFHQPQQRVGGIQQLIQRFTNPTSSGTPLTTKGISGLSNTLNNVQQVLRVVQSAAPLVEEYGPMIKNLPAMYKMYKAMKDMSNEEGEDGEEGNTEREQSSTTKTAIQETEQRNNESIKVENKSNDSLGQSIPKLYI